MHFHFFAKKNFGLTKKRENCGKCFKKGEKHNTVFLAWPKKRCEKYED